MAHLAPATSNENLYIISGIQPSHVGCSARDPPSPRPRNDTCARDNVAVFR
jgi:hypothetical protein